MRERGVHYLALSDIRKRLDKNAEDYNVAAVQLTEALKLGDLRENSEYDTAKESMGRIVAERDMLTPVLQLPVVKANDNVSIIEEGCVLDIKVYKAIPSPVSVNSDTFRQLTSVTPAFEGKVMFGGTLPMQELLVDAALGADTPIGAFLLGKRSGPYCIRVPGGFSPVIVKKLRSDEFDVDELGCVYNG